MVKKRLQLQFLGPRIQNNGLMRLPCGDLKIDSSFFELKDAVIKFR